VGETVLFESAVILEYLDEVAPPSFHPSDPLQKGLNRAWIEFSSELFVDLYRTAMAQDRAAFEAGRQAAREKLLRLEAQVGLGPFFNGTGFSLLDAAIAPAFMRMDLMEEIHPLALLDGLPKVRRWSEALLERKSVRISRVLRALFRVSCWRWGLSGGENRVALRSKKEIAEETLVIMEFPGGLVSGGQEICFNDDL
jgi:glutathione S-transferase